MMGGLGSILISCLVFFLIISFLPYLIWLFIILAIVSAIFRIFRNNKIRKMNEQYYQDYHQNEQQDNNNYTYQNTTKSNVDSDVIDVEFTQSDDE